MLSLETSQTPDLCNEFEEGEVQFDPKSTPAKLELKVKGLP